MFLQQTVAVSGNGLLNATSNSMAGIRNR